MEKVIKVDGMTCNHCKASVEDAANSINGVEGQVNLEQGTLTLQMENDQTEAVKAAVEDIGFDVII